MCTPGCGPCPPCCGGPPFGPCYVACGDRLNANCGTPWHERSPPCYSQCYACYSPCQGPYYTPECPCFPCGPTKEHCTSSCC